MSAKIIIIYKTRTQGMTSCRKLTMNCQFFTTNKTLKLDNKSKILIFEPIFQHN